MSISVTTFIVQSKLPVQSLNTQEVHTCSFSPDSGPLEMYMLILHNNLNFVYAFECNSCLQRIYFMYMK